MAGQKGETGDVGPQGPQGVQGPQSQSGACCCSGGGGGGSGGGGGGGTVTLTAGPGITVNGLEISNAHLFSASSGVAVSKFDNAHLFTNTLPICDFTVAGTTYAAGTVSEIIFGTGATSTLNGGQLTVEGFGASGDVVAAGNGIALVLANGVKTISNTAMAPNITVGGQTFGPGFLTEIVYDNSFTLIQTELN